MPIYKLSEERRMKYHLYAKLPEGYGSSSGMITISDYLEEDSERAMDTGEEFFYSQRNLGHDVQVFLQDVSTGKDILMLDPNTVEWVDL